MITRINKLRQLAHFYERNSYRYECMARTRESEAAIETAIEYLLIADTLHDMLHDAPSSKVLGIRVQTELQAMRDMGITWGTVGEKGILYMRLRNLDTSYNAIKKYIEYIEKCIAYEQSFLE